LKFRCSRCGGDVPAADPATLSEGFAVVCPHCGARYRRRGSSSASRADLATIGETAGPTTRAGRSWRETASASAGVGQASSGPGKSFAGQASPSASTRGTSSRPRSFEAGDLVAMRYRVLSFVAAGGMGEVYRVEDQELGGVLALKTVRRQASHRGTQHALERFRREVQLARQVTHPNVCRIFDVGFHQPEDGDSSITFLTMELLEGTTLSQRLARSGPMSTSQAQPLVADMCAGLTAIHARGIVHRDFKSDNVTIARSGTAERAVVTDFGIARGIESDDFEVRSAAGASLVGTPAYLAPEQVGQGEITPAADVYALGIVLYEMVTGKVPFRGENALATAAMRLTEAPKPPSALVPTLHPRWERAILRCLERDPAQRFASVEEVAAEIAPKAFSIDQRAVVEEEKRSAAERERQRVEAEHQKRVAAQRVVERKTHRLRLMLLSILLLLTLGFAAQQVWDRLRAQPAGSVFAPGPVRARTAMAVLDFQNRNGRPESAWLEGALPEMLASDLGGSEDLRLIPQGRVAAMHRELELGPLAELSTATLRRIGDYLGADLAIGGSYTALEDGALRVDLRLLDLRSGEPTWSGGLAGSEEHLFSLVDQAAAAVRGQLEIAPRQTSNVNPLPRDRKAAKLYVQGLELLRDREAEGALAALDEAAQAEPDNAMIQTARASALGMLGLTADAGDAARRAFELAQGLPDRERLEIAGRFGRLEQQWDRAVDAYLTLWRAYPDNLEYGLELVATQVEAGRGEEALANVAGLHRLPAGNDPRVDLTEARAAAAVVDTDRQLAAARRAHATATTLGAREWQAEARLAEADALLRSGLPDEALEACREALYIYRELGHRQGEAVALSSYAAVRSATGGFDEAILLYEQALAVFVESSDRQGQISTLNNLGVALRRRGDLAAARARYEEAERIAAGARDPIARYFALNNLGVLAITSGSLHTAIASLEQALVVAQEMGRRDGVASALGNQGVAYRELGELEQARELGDRAQAIRVEIDDRAGLLASFGQRGALRLVAGDVAAAETAFRELEREAARQEARPWRAEALRGLGRVARLRGDRQEALRLAGEARRLREELTMTAEAQEDALDQIELELDFDPASAHALGDLPALLADAAVLRPDVAARGFVLLARAQRSAGDLAAAASSLTEAGIALGDNERLQPRLELELERAQQLAAPSGDPATTSDRATAQAVLDSVVEQAQAAGLVPLRLRALVLRAALTADAGARASVEAEALRLGLIGLTGLTGLISEPRHCASALPA
jgi:tetratricopeptide (TPR) repeat protein/DNA-directed RNA polymerase subunit RPC12/RpoP